MAKTRGIVFEADFPRTALGAAEPPDVCRDLSRFKNHGVHTDITWIQLPTGKWVRGFNGATSKIEIPHAANMTFTSGPFSFICWFRTSDVSPATWYTFFNKGLINTDGWEFALGNGSNDIRLHVYQAAAWQQNQSYGVITENNKWYCIGFTRAAATGLLYVQGADETETAVAYIDPVTNTRVSTIGLKPAGSNQFLGDMGAAILLNYTLSPGRMAAYIEATRRDFGP